MLLLCSSGKVVPESAVLEMKSNFSLPEDRDNLFDRIDYVELPKDVVLQLVRQYVLCGGTLYDRGFNIFQVVDHHFFCYLFLYQSVSNGCFGLF